MKVSFDSIRWVLYSGGLFVGGHDIHCCELSWVAFEGYLAIHFVTTRVVVKYSMSENKPYIFFRTSSHDTRRREVFLGDFLTSKFDWKWNLVRTTGHDTSSCDEWK